MTLIASSLHHSNGNGGWFVGGVLAPREGALRARDGVAGDRDAARRQVPAGDVRRGGGAAAARAAARSAGRRRGVGGVGRLGQLRDNVALGPQRAGRRRGGRRRRGQLRGPRSRPRREGEIRRWTVTSLLPRWRATKRSPDDAPRVVFAHLEVEPEDADGMAPPPPGTRVRLIGYTTDGDEVLLFSSFFFFFFLGWKEEETRARQEGWMTEWTTSRHDDHSACHGRQYTAVDGRLHDRRRRGAQDG